MQEERTSAMSLWTEAASYGAAARCLSEAISDQKLKLPYPHPVLFLIGHSLEVILKAKPRARAYTLGQLIKLGHGLEDLIDEVEKDGRSVPLSRDERDHVGLLDSLHGTQPFRTRYPVTGYVQLPDQQILIGAIDRLIELAKPECVAALHSAA
jgi:hypothetical protein